MVSTFPISPRAREGAGGAGIQGVEAVRLHDRQNLRRIGVGAEQAKAHIGPGDRHLAPRQDGGARDLGGHRALAGAARSRQQDAARGLKINWRLRQALGDGVGQRRVGADFGKIRGFAHQFLAQIFGQTMALHRRAQQGAQIARGGNSTRLAFRPMARASDLAQGAQAHRGMDFVLAHHHRGGAETLDDGTDEGTDLRAR